MVKITKATVAVKEKAITAPKKKVVEAKRIQTAEGWKRSMIKMRKAEEAKPKKTKS